ncbi:MAG: zeta toxin [Bacteroidetes bacterium]|nr:MAG: zeta toxin [Bacteroidota bacterium]
MSSKKIRIFAGANGSGKSTFIRDFESNYNARLHIFVNADEIEATLKRTHKLNFSDFKLEISTENIQNYFKNSTFSPIKLQNPLLFDSLWITENVLHFDKNLQINSYIAADIAEFIRQNLVLSNHSFSYETVMSNAIKIDFLEMAKSKGYKIYFYYFTTNDPEINIARVKLRVEQGGHNVPEATIIDRYYKSLELLKSAIKTSDQAYLMDNSKEINHFVAQITNGNEFETILEDELPNWVHKYVIL